MAVEILVVDDNDKNLRSMSLLLGDIDAEVVHAQSGNEALLKLLTRDFAVILLDVQMPDMDGFETAKLIRARDRSRHTPIIFVTAFDRSEKNQIAGYSLGAVDFLFKPVVPEILKAKVSFFLELYRKTQETKRQAELLRGAEKRDHERSLTEARVKYERALLNEEMQRERKVAEALKARAEELARLVEEKELAEAGLRKNNERLTLLVDFANQLLLEADPEAVVPRVLRRFADHLELDAFLDYRVGEQQNLLLAAGTAGLASGVTAPPIPLGHGAMGRAALDGHRVVLDPGEVPPGDLLEVLGLRSAVVLPMSTSRRLLGVLALGSRSARRFTHEELTVAQLLVDQFSVSLDRAQLIAELRESDRRKDEFLAMLGHELRNPLAPIRNSLELFRLRGGNDEIFQRAVAATERQVGHMTRLVDDLLDVSRITRGKVQLRRTRVELSMVIEQAVQGSEPLIRSRRHQLEVRLPDEPIVLDADSSRLTQIFANLLQNAAKYTEPGGTIRLTAERFDNEVVVRVTDNGIGIRPEMLSRIFDMFVQEEPTSDRALGGLGLGLTLVRSLVEMHGGQVKAKSEGLGRGSEFAVRLPLAPGEPEHVNGTRPHLELVANENNEMTPLNILLVEDNADIRSTMRDLLELKGHRVVEASDGVSAVEVAMAERPNVALVDIGLPGFDGYRVAELLRAAAGMSHTRLVALTGYGTEEARQKAKDAGFHAHLIKPVAADDLWRLLKQLA